MTAATATTEAVTEASPAVGAAADPADGPAEAPEATGDASAEVSATPIGAPTPDTASPEAALEVEAAPEVPAAPARGALAEALTLPTAVEDTAAFVPRPGSPAAMPEVQAARAEVEAARAGLGREVTALKLKGRATFDVKTRVRGLPSAIAADPRKLAATGAAAAGVGLLAVRRIRGRGKGRAMPPGLLPAEVEETLSGLGGDAGRVREALDSSFTRYLVASGAQTPRRRRRIPPSVGLFLLPVASTVVREMIKRAARRPAARE